MTHKSSASVFSALAMAVGGAQAIQGPETGDSAVLFVAIDHARTVSVAIDLRVHVSDFLQADARVTDSNGSLSTPGTTAGWNFFDNTRVVNDVAVAGGVWSSGWSTFLSVATSGYTWAVVGGDSILQAPLQSITGRNLLTTGRPAQSTVGNFTSPSAVGTGLANFGESASGISAMQSLSTLGDAVVASDGPAYLGTRMGDDFGALPWSYLTSVGDSTQLFLVQQSSADPVVYQLGNWYGTDTVQAGNVATFTSDGTTLAYAVPEPASYALLLSAWPPSPRQCASRPGA